MSDAVEVVVEEPVIPSEAIETEDDDADFESGFAGAPTEVTPPAEGEEEEAAPVAAATEAAPVAEEIKYRQVTEAEWADLTTKAAAIDQMRTDTAKRLDTAFGKVGGLERTLAALQSATPAGYAVEVTDDIVADLKEEFPELGDLVLKSIKGFASKLKGTAPSAAVDLKQVTEAATAQIVALQTEALEEEHANWRSIVGTPDSNNDYRQWLAKQSAEYQQKLGSTNSAVVIGRSITKFEADAAKAKADADKAAATSKPTRQERLEAAATPRGAGGHSPADTEDDFEAGFASG